MRREEISRALSMLDQKYILEALEPAEPGGEAPKVNYMKITKHGARNLRRTLLIAAVISLFFAVTAFAIGYGINLQRQQELREQLQIDENQVEEYTEYPLPEETGEEVSSEDEMTVALLSSIGGVEYDTIYINVSPYEKDWIYGEMPVGASFDGGESFATCTPAMKNGEMIYDETTKTITFECHRFHSSPYTDEMIVAYGQGDSKRELGRFRLSISQVETRLCLFEKPVEFSVDELGKTGRLLGVELYSSGMTWLLENEDSERLYYYAKGLSFEDLSREDQEWIRSVEAPWANAISAVTQGTLHMADGSDMEPRSAESGDYQDGIVKRYSSFAMSTIDPDDVVSITLFDGSTVELD